MQIGTIEYEARVTGADDAREDADALASSQYDVAAASDEAAASGGFLAGRLSDTATASEEAGQEADRTSSKSRILASALFFLGTTAVGTIGKITGLTGAFALVRGGATALIGTLSGLTLSGVIGTVTGAISGFIGWLAAGSAGAIAFAGAIGAGLGILGVWILQVTGALDAVRGFGRFVRDSLPAWVVDGLTAMIGLAAGPLAVLGNFITGTLEGGFDEGFARARATIDVFVGAWERTGERIKGVAADAVGFVGRKFDQLGDAAVGVVRDTWNSNIPGQVNIPSVTIAGRTFGGGGISIPRLQVGGMIRESGIAQVHSGEAVIPEPLVNAANGGGGGGGDVTIERLVFNLSGDFDPSNVSRRDLEQFAQKIDQILGKQTNRTAGVR